MIWALYIAGGLHAALVLWLCGGWLFRIRPPRSEGGKEPLSVIIAAHNEARNLHEFLPTILAQDYPGEFEIILALDRCTDNSAKVAEELAQGHDRLRILRIDDAPAGMSPKKHALERAIAAARHERLLFTDADCAAGPHWLSEADRHFDNNTDVVIGLGPYRRRPGLLNLFVRYETLYTALQYIGWAAWGLPYMSVGRNWAYRKSKFEAAGGFGEDRARLSGDDDLLLRRLAPKRKRTRLMLSPASQTVSIPPETAGAWWRQKKRHFSAGGAYKPLIQFILSAFHASQAIFFISLIVELAADPASVPVWSAYLLRMVLVTASLGLLQRWWRDPGLLLIWPLLDLLYVIYHVTAAPAGLISQPKWKETDGGSLQEYTG